MPTVVPVRFKFNPKTYWYTSPQVMPSKGDRVIIACDEGKMFGWVENDPFELSPEQERSLKSPLKPILRIATDEDMGRLEELGEKGVRAKEVFRELAKKRELDIKPIDVEYLMDADRAIFHFSSEERVDFRELVRDLASRLRIHVDMKQIGVRDEARMIGGLGHCGGELCCVKMHGAFQPVSIRMAKEQDLPLNPGKVSGACGRLMCCLRYEFEAYKDFKARAPKVNAAVETPAGQAKVVELDTLRERVRIRMVESGEVFYVPLSGMIAEGEDDQQSRPNAVSEETFRVCCPAKMLREKEFEISENEILDQEAPSRRRRRRKRGGKRKPGEQDTSGRAKGSRGESGTVKRSGASEHGGRAGKGHAQGQGQGDESQGQRKARRRRSRSHGGESASGGQNASSQPSQQKRSGTASRQEGGGKRKQRPGQNSSNIRNPQDRQGDRNHGDGSRSSREGASAPKRSRRRRGSRGSSDRPSGQAPSGRRPRRTSGGSDSQGNAD